MTDNQTEMELEAEAPETIEGETKAEKFKRLAVYRYIKTVQRIRQIGNLANTNNYEYNGEDVQSMFAKLRAELDKAEQEFSRVSNNTIEGPF